MKITKEKKYTINKSKAEVRSVLTDLENYALIHPLIVSAILIEGAQKPIKTYKIREQPYFFLPFKISYHATVYPGETDIRYLITGIPFLQPTIIYHMEHSDPSDRTQITFTLSISGTPFLGKMLMSKMLQAQDQLMEAWARK